MRSKPMAKLVSFFVIMLAVAYVAVIGIEVGIYDWIPWHQGIARGLDLGGSASVTYLADAPETTAEQMKEARQVIRTRLDYLGCREAAVMLQGDDTVRAEIPLAYYDQQIFTFLSSPFRLEFLGPNEEVLLDSADIQKGSAAVDLVTSTTLGVKIALTPAGSKKAADILEAYKGQTLNVKMDGTSVAEGAAEEILPSNKRAVLQGASIASDTNAAGELAVKINVGQLPVTMEMGESLLVTSASLGQSALTKIKLGGIIGLGLILLALLYFYRLPGLMAGVSLASYLALTAFVLATVKGVLLTLPALTGLLLGIFMTLAAFVFINERIREERLAGKSMRASVEAGFDKASSAILDTGLAVLAGSLALWGLQTFFKVGTGPMKEFGVTLSLATLVCMFISLLVYRWVLRWIIDVRRKPWADSLFISPKALAARADAVNGGEAL